MGARACSTIGIFALVAHHLSAQPVLSRTGIARADTCAGSVAVVSQTVDPQPGVTIVVLSDTLPEDDMARFRQEMVSLYDSAQRGKNQNLIRLAVLTSGNVQFAGPFRTKALLQAALSEISPATSESVAAIQPARFYSVLGAAAANLGADWATVVLAGRFPVIPEEGNAFATAWLSAQFRTAKLRIGSWSPPGAGSAMIDAIANSTAGLLLTEGLASLNIGAKEETALHAVSWQNPAPARSFQVCPVSLVGDDGQPVLQIPTLIAAAGATLPGIEQYALLREKTRAVTAALALPDLTAAQSAQAEADLAQVLAIDPQAEDLLRLALTLFRREHNDRKLVAVLATLTEMFPAEEPLFTELGHARYRLGDAAGAEAALLRSRGLKPGNGDVAEELTAIHLSHKDDRGALPFLEEACAAHPGKQELWLLRADLATRLDDWPRMADSIERAIVLGEVPLERRTGIIRVYLAHQMPERALPHVRAVAGQLPNDPILRAEYAGFFDTMHQPDEALVAWKRALESDPKLELAHQRVTRLLLDKNALPEALEAAEAGIAAAPKSAPLYLAKADILEKQGRFYDARRTLRAVAPEIADPPLLLRLAEMEDAGGEHAARYYRQWLEEDKSAAAAEHTRIARRGLEVAERDGDLQSAGWFRTQLGTGAAAVSAPGGTVAIPGGLDALSYIARSRQSSPDRFLVEYARTVLRYLEPVDKKVVDAYVAGIRDHFRRIAELLALGTAKDGKVTVTLSVQDKKSQKDAEKVLDLLGWKMHATGKGVKLEAAEKGARATHQETASALAIDEVGMQEALEAGKSFSFDIVTENAPVVIGEEPWRTQFYPKEKFAGGLAEAIAGDLHLAQTYAALGQMESSTAAALVSAVGLKTLAEKHAPLLVQYSSALAMEKGHVAVPGGSPAEPIWTSIVGANPSQPAAFLRALLSKDDGKLLAYYGRLGALDIEHQRFFTRSATRTQKFYELFKESPEMQRANARYIPTGSFAEMLNELPLADDSVVFPGSPEVWMVAKGRSTGNVGKMMKKVQRTTAPDVEDEILLRLARTHYGDVVGERSELDNFLAVVRVDAHRSDPLDEASALLLAQRFAQDGAAYPYFASLTGLGQKEFEGFFALSDSIRSRPDNEKSTVLGPVSAMIEIVSLAQQGGALTAAQAAALFGRIVTVYQGAASAAARVSTSLDLLGEILTRSGTPASADADEAMARLLLGNSPPIELEVDGAAVSLDPSKARHAAYRRVMELQKSPSLATILGLGSALRSLAAGKDPAPPIQALKSLSAGLYSVEVPKDLKLNGKEREELEGFQPRRLQEIIKQFEEKTAKKKVNPKDLEKLSQDYLEEMDAPVRWALEGVLYAYFLSPDDLVVSEDALLLRKHLFVVSSGMHKVPLWQPSAMEQTSEKAGSYFSGSFANFGDAAGWAAAMSAKLGGEVGLNAASKQMAAIRLTGWDGLRDDDLRLVGLKVTVAREWMVRAASQPEMESALAESTLGLLSLTRRADLFSAIAAGNWASVWKLATLGDLYFLGDRYLERYQTDPWQSPATQALRQLASRDDGSRLQALGSDHTDMFGCSHAHLESAPPYEEYEKELMSLRIAERSAEFKLYLAKSADVAGIPARALGVVAEPAARAVLKRMQLSDAHDWRSILAAYATLDGRVLEGILAK